jgi:hypothetical protein
MNKVVSRLRGKMGESVITYARRMLATKVRNEQEVQQAWPKHALAPEEVIKGATTRGGAYTKHNLNRVQNSDH